MKEGFGEFCERVRNVKSIFTTLLFPLFFGIAMNKEGDHAGLLIVLSCRF